MRMFAAVWTDRIGSRLVFCQACFATYIRPGTTSATARVDKSRSDPVFSHACFATHIRSLATSATAQVDKSESDLVFRDEMIIGTSSIPAGRPTATSHIRT